ncbi:MAG: hypothetical protein IPP10_00495 [Candidatus Competibacteraceae bacterium]|nr:hypothetical protein [Candidatus Competibacteraceae bacterium]
MKSITTWSIIAVVASSIAACKPSDNALSANTSQATQPAAQQPTISTPPKEQASVSPPSVQPNAENIKRFNDNEAEMNSRKYWVDLKSASGEKISVAFYEESGDQLYVDVKTGGKTVKFSKIAENSGNPVFGDGDKTTLVSREGGGVVELITANSKKIYK